MFPFIPIAVLSMAHAAYAHLGRFQPRMEAEECCPCPGPDNQIADGGLATITVTEVAPAPAPVTVYISHEKQAPLPTAKTVTVHSTLTESPLTVYVTQSDNLGPSGSVTVEEVVHVIPKPEPVTVTVHPDGSKITPDINSNDPTVKERPGVKTQDSDDAMIKDGKMDDVMQSQTDNNGNAEDPEDGKINHMNNGNGGSQDIADKGRPKSTDRDDGKDVKKDDQHKSVVTETIRPDPGQNIPKTVTISIAPAEDKTAIVSPNNPTITVTAIPQHTSPSAPEQPEDQLAPDAGTKTVVVSYGPNIEAMIPFHNSTRPVVETMTPFNNSTKPDVEIMTPFGNSSAMTVTASPSTETVSLVQTINNYQTITQSVHNGHNIDIEITIINIDTGAKTCANRDTGLPCSSEPGRNTTIPITPSTTPAVAKDPCPPGTNLTSIAASFNTVTFTRVKRMANDDADARHDQPTRAEPLTPRTPRGPRSLRW